MPEAIPSTEAYLMLSGTLFAVGLIGVIIRRNMITVLMAVELMMNAEQYVIDHHLAQVISQSFGASEETFDSTAALENLRGAFKSAKLNNVSVFASSGDFGNSNVAKTPVGGAAPNPLIQFPNVGWPGSDPLVTSVGGTYLCANANTGSRVADNVAPPVNCQVTPGVTEIGWVAAGGGFSHVFAKPAYQNTLPPGSNTGLQLGSALCRKS